MGAPTFRVSDLPPQAIRAFRSLTEAGLSGASRIEIPLHLIVRRRIQAIVNFENIKKREAI